MLWIPVDRTAEKPLIRQVYDQIRQQILHGELHAGDRLPSTRELAEDIHVSRNVILEAYDQLLAEGYIESRRGSGTYVAEGASFAFAEADIPQPAAASFASSAQKNSDIINFRSGLPALDHFPRKLWSHLTQQIYQQADASLFGYDSPEGRLELRQALSRYLLRTRGVRCSLDQLLITTGAAQAFSLLTNLLLTPDSRVIVEDPITNEVQTIYTRSGATLVPVPVDMHGIQTDLLPADERAAFAVVTPSHQYPLGSILPIQRRIALINFARATDCYLVEDDYDSEFRYSGPPVSSLQGLDPERVIYIGTFSKILSPALRIGYMILPSSLITSSRQTKRLSDLHSPTLDQLVLARFIEEGHLERHIMKMKRLYHKRRDTLISSLNHTFGKLVQIEGESTGLHLVAAFPGINFTDTAIMQALEQTGVQVYPVEIHAVHTGYHSHQIVLGYGNLTEEEIIEGVKRIAHALQAEV
ncbi:GntR family transcriptional regulator [Reticulibacter mediterranei]|uniref:GntR family transcriptional regulator n=1 Tax=Reticulibacter mediterranei TaxID=2778369 RepID=A0A8J3IRJ3_9CHLR|nr:PLP-dependent aminotransferase family protein [Reticulibacter mediterranei]GHO95622.1 GntR family transcriptional regulator [Reticulibacter mediterranei]